MIGVQRVSIDHVRIDAPAREARELVLFALGCTAAAAAVSLAIVRWPVPLYEGADFTASAWYALAFKLGFMLGVPLAWMRWRGYRFADVLGTWRSSAGAFAAIGLAIVAGLALNAQHVGPIGDLLHGDVACSRIALGLVLPLVSAAIPEELVFRVLLQTRLEKVGGRLIAVGASTVLFVLWHLPSRFLLATGVEGTAGDLGSILRGTALPVFVVGLVLAAIWDRWRTFPVLVALHYSIDVLPSLRHALGGTF
jgi:membrane protease YdiL (CAAX protease family)